MGEPDRRPAGVTILTLGSLSRTDEAEIRRELRAIIAEIRLRQEEIGMLRAIGDELCQLLQVRRLP